MDFPERDWKRLRALQPVALDRYCTRVLEESAAIIGHSESPHERYLRLYRLLQERDATMAAAFDDLRRSTATRRLASLVGLDLLTEDELSEFSPSVRDTASGLSKLFAPTKPRSRARS